MVYKIGNVADIEKIRWTDDAWKLVHHYARVLTAEYGANRNVDQDDGGYILYVPAGTPFDELKACFDYTKHQVEYVDRYEPFCSAMYILHNEFAVVIVMSMADAPAEITDHFEEGY